MLNLRHKLSLNSLMRILDKTETVEIFVGKLEFIFNRVHLRLGQAVSFGLVEEEETVRQLKQWEDR